jgi:hypothetical protein
MNKDIRKLIKKVDELKKQLNQQNEYIMDQSIIIQKLIEKLVVIPTAPSITAQKVNMYGEVIPQYPFDTSY